MGRLRELFIRLRDICPVCWVYARQEVPREQHKMFQHCPDARDQRALTDGDWIKWKKDIKFLIKHEYCYWCALPANEFLPEDHPPVGAKCNYVDISFPALHAVRHYPRLWARAVDQFADLTHNTTPALFAKWCPLSAGTDSFSNGLELLLWLDENP